jgi:lipoprotein-anchoring transpeptidase ErfK/SrfK
MIMRTSKVFDIKLCFLILAFLISSQSRMAYAFSSPVEAETINWLKPTGGPYPRLEADARLWVKVSLERQRVDIMNGGVSIYTMVVSTGLDSPADDRTPVGTFYVQRERGLSFYSAKLREGAHYWVSWLNHGEYLFHSIPTDRKGNIIVSEAQKLGTKASHGCIRLALPDAKWIYRNIRVGTRVVIDP